MWPEGVCLIVDSTTISNLFYNLQSAPKSTIYNLGKIRLKSTILPKSQNSNLQIYKAWIQYCCCDHKMLSIFQLSCSQRL